MEMKKILIVLSLTLGAVGTANAAVDLSSSSGFSAFSNELGGAIRSTGTDRV